MAEPFAESDAPLRGHLLTITKSDDWHEDEPCWDWSLTCQAPNLCGGWWECSETHEVDGLSASDGPYACETSAPWCDEDEFEFHGVTHTWRYGWGWTVPYEGCVVQTADIGDGVDDIAREHGEGTYEVDDDWDETSCYIAFGTRVLPPGVQRG